MVSSSAKTLHFRGKLLDKERDNATHRYRDRRGKAAIFQALQLLD